VIDNQPNGMVFGPDGYLYLGVGSLTDHLEPPFPDRMPFAELQPYEASILRIQPHTGEIEIYAQGIRNPYDVTFDSTGQFYATDNGILEGPGDRLLRIDAGGHYGFPYWRTRGCADCPARDASLTISDDLFAFPDYTLPRGLVAYTGSQFPENIVDSVFVTLWHNTPNAQRVVRIDPKAIPTNPDRLAEYMPEPFVTGLIHPVDIVIAPDGSLVIADFIYGHIWRVSYIGDGAATTSSSQTSQIENPPATATAGSSLFITATPRP
jgi:glucose/arabinose dehydrogenase